MTDWNRYVDIPFKEKGRTAAGCDCWGLVCLIYKQELGIDLPSYDDQYFRTSGHQVVHLFEKERKKWKHVKRECPGDVVVLKIKGLARHCGVIIRPGVMVHSWNGTNSVTEPLDNDFWKNRIDGFYRYHPGNG